MTDSLLVLILERIQALGDIVKDSHYELEKYRPELLNSMQRITLGLKLENAVKEQNQWIDEILGEKNV